MADVPPGPGPLPDTFAVFPLSGALLLPKGKLPLNIFEPRYLAMTEDALAAGRLFGMIQPDPAAPRHTHGPGLHRVGCLGRISSFSETDDGRYLITLSGVSRFRIVEELEMRRGYRRVRAELAPYAADLETAEPSPTPLPRAPLLRALRNYFRTRGYSANWDAIERMADAALVATLAMACPFTPTEKQALLEAPTETERATALLALLEIDTHAAGAAAAPRPS